MLNQGEIRLVPVEKRHMPEVVLLLQDISVFMPEEGELDGIWSSYKSQNDIHSIVALNKSDEVLGFGTLLVETKIRGGKLGHIEDIVVHESHRGSGLGKEIVLALAKSAEDQGCYKIVLNCSTANAGFYENAGLVVNGVSMQRLFR